jgi:hypothetical protein
MAENTGRSGGKGVGFHKGSLGSPFQLETYGPSGVNAGESDYEDGPRIGPGVLKRVTMEVDRGGGKGGKSSNGR